MSWELVRGNDNIRVWVRASGPIFEGNAPSRVRGTTQNAIREMVELGEQRLDQILRPRPAGVYLSVAQAKRGKASKGHYRRSLHATLSSLNGRIDDGNVEYGKWLEGTSSRNQSTRFPGYHSFLKTAQWLETKKAGVLHAHVNRLVRDLS